MTLDPAIARMVEQLVAAARPEQIILFGSRATGAATTCSDADFLVVMPLTKPRRRLEGDLHAAVVDSPIAKDILVVTPEEIVRFRDVPGTIIQPALATGKVVYRRGS